MLLEELNAGVIDQEEYREERRALSDELKERLAAVDEEIEDLKNPARRRHQRSPSPDWDEDALARDIERGSSVVPPELEGALQD